MPLYEYKCEKCGEEFEKMQKFSDEPVKVHENCGGAVRRLLTAPTFQFKGTGWYITDYAHGKSGANGNGRNSHSHNESKGESKGDSKGESKSESSSSKTDSSAAPAGTSKTSSDK